MSHKNREEMKKAEMKKAEMKKAEMKKAEMTEMCKITLKCMCCYLFAPVLREEPP